MAAVARSRLVSVVLVGLVVVLALTGAVVASGRTRDSRRAVEHRAPVAHPRLAVRGAERPALAAGAAHGGRVIVLLKKKNADISLARGLARRHAVDSAQQAPIVANMKRFGGSRIRKLTIVNAVAGTVSAKEALRLSKLSSVAQVVPDETLTETVPIPKTTSNVATPAQQVCPSDPGQPLVEPEALQSMNDEGPGPDEADTIADGTGVTVAIEGMNELAGNPNFTRANGQHVVEDAPDYNPADIPNDENLDEWFGDASSVAAQGTVTYDYSAELPFSGLPKGCTFVIKGDATGSTLVDLSLVDPAVTLSDQGGQRFATVSQSESSVIAGMENAIMLHADVISESYGGGNTALATADDAAVAAGVTVVASSGDEGFDNTFISPADDPDVIGVGATTDMRLTAQAYGFTSWTNDNIATLSSTGTGQPTSEPNAAGKVVDLVAPGYGGEVACSPLVTKGCPTNALTEAFGGTSESAPFVAGAAADVIQAYSDSHGGTRPTPALVQQILDGSARDIDAPAGEQGAGIVDIYAAVRTAQEEPGTTLQKKDLKTSQSLVSSPTQIDVSGSGGTSVPSQLNLYNVSTKSTKVTATLKQLGPAKQIGKTVTEPVSAPDPSLPVPADGATAAAPITFTVPKGTDRISANMIWPDPTNDNTLYYILTDPQGKLAQISYDFGVGSTKAGAIGGVPNIQHTEVSDPTPGKWTATILWGNGRAHLQEPPNVPGTYTGNLSFEVNGQNYVTSKLGGGTVKIPAESTAPLTVEVPLASAPGDDDNMSVQLSGNNGAAASVPILARTLIPPTGGAFAATMGTSVGRSSPPASQFFVDVPAGHQSMSVSFNTADASADNAFSYELFSPTGQEIVADATPTTTLLGIGSTTPTAKANLSVANPVAGRWEIVVASSLTTSGQEFSQTINGDVAFDNSGVTVLSGLPTATTTTVAQGTSQTVQLQVTNTTGVGRTFSFTASGGDIAPVSTYIPAGVTELVTLTLTPKAAAGTVVSASLAVTTNTSARRTPNQPTLAVLPYTYTVGPPASPAP
jgi:Subtilase family